jgi:hypothetical protein
VQREQNEHALVVHSGGPTAAISASFLGLHPTRRATLAWEAGIVDADHVWSVEGIVGALEAK